MEHHHTLTPKHEKLTAKEKDALLAAYALDHTQLPKIYIKDAVLEGVDVKVGDIVKITRASPTARTSTYYRVVING